mgnify:CR=1 FL=1
MNKKDRYDGAIALIKSQTNYTEQEANEKLEKWEGNYMNVIKEYLNPNFNIKKQKVDKRSTNEKMMTEIRDFMDTASLDFEKRKAKEEKKQAYLKEVYQRFLDVNQHNIPGGTKNNIETFPFNIPYATAPSLRR